MPSALDNDLLSRLPLLENEILKTYAVQEEKLFSAGLAQLPTALFYVASSTIMIGEIAFLLHRAVGTYKADLSTAAKLGGMCIPGLKFDGVPVRDDLLGTAQTNFVIAALCAGDLDLARALAENIARYPDAERKFGSRWEVAFAHMLKAVLIEGLALEQCAQELLSAVETKLGAKLAALSETLIAIGRSDSASIDTAFDSLVAESLRLSRGRGLYAGKIESILSSKGIALANLALSKGLSVTPRKLIPGELLIEASNSR